MFYLFVLLVVVEPVRLFAGTTHVARLLAGGAVIATAAVCAYGAASVARGPFVERLRVPIRRLDPRLAGLRIVQLSDLHVGPSLGRAFVEKVVDLVNAESPDVVVITGDLVDGDVERVAPDVEPLRGLRARHGVLFVTGNHDFYSGADAWTAHVASLGLRVLHNERTTIEHDGASIDFAGVEDPTGRSIGEGPDFAAALDGRVASRPVVLLAHQPVAVTAAAARDVDLVLSGHTHGGQMWPFGLIERPFHPAVEGLHRFGATWLYVSRGTGFWGPPIRVLEPAEITVIELAAD
jgi:predicted MPP superfamily phosphohydrolase